MTSHTRKWKESQATELQQLADKHPVVAVASITGFPGALAKELRKKLKGKAVVKVSKTRVIERALKLSKAETKGLEAHVKGSVAVIFTDMNPFELYAFLKKNKVKMPAKAGMIAPDNVTVPAGDTGLPPGPALSDLKAAGLKTVMQGPTISIAEDKVVAKKGEEITAGVAGALSKLGIKPVKVGLNVVACLERGQLFLASVLDIDTDKVFAQFVEAHRNAFNLAVEAGYFTKGTVELLLGKAFKQAKAVALEANLLTSATVEDVLAKANRQAAALKGMVKDTVPEEKKGEDTNAEEEKEGKTEGASGKKKEGEAPKEEEKPAEEKKEEATAVERKEEEKPAEEKKEEATAVEKKDADGAEEKPAEEKKE